MKSINSKSHGFTMIEVVIVIMVLASIAAVAIPHYIDHRNAANHAVVEAAAKAFGSGITIAASANIAQGETGAVTTPKGTLLFYWGRAYSGGQYVNTGVYADLYAPYWNQDPSNYPSPIIDYISAGYGGGFDGNIYNNTSNPSLSYYEFYFTIPTWQSSSTPERDDPWPATTGSYAPAATTAPTPSGGPSNHAAACSDMWNIMVEGYTSTTNSSGADFKATATDDTTQCTYTFLGDTTVTRQITYDYSNGSVKTINP
jgi:prepilin-type N-terminal cleavage/methylation domain-containing protein